MPAIESKTEKQPSSSYKIFKPLWDNSSDEDRTPINLPR